MNAAALETLRSLGYDPSKWTSSCETCGKPVAPNYPQCPQCKFAEWKAAYYS